VGNLYAKRDWGHAKDFVKGFWLINNHKEPSDFVIATQQCITVKDFLLQTFTQAGFPNLKFVESGLDEKLVSNERVLVSIDP
jgi:GDPmannose 4,6-dehydratase